MNTSEKTYIKVLKGLFERGDEEEIKKYILSFNENDDEYDIFIQKLQEFVKIDEIDIIEEMIYDDELVSYRDSSEDYDFNDEQELETYLLGEEEEKEEFDNIASEEDDDELSMENLKREVSDDVESWGEDLLGKIGIEDLSK